MFGLNSWQAKSGDEVTLANRRIANGFIELVTALCNDGCEMGISPRDDVLTKNDAKSMRRLIIDTIGKVDCRYVFVGEYSPEKHRLHYHGVIICKSLDDREKVKRRIANKIGRCESECIRNVEQYVKYMFKSYPNEATMDQCGYRRLKDWLSHMVIHPRLTCSEYDIIDYWDEENNQWKQ